MLQKRGLLEYKKSLGLYFSVTDHNVFCYINFASFPLSYLVWGVAEDFKNKMSKYQPCAIRNRGALGSCALFCAYLVQNSPHPLYLIDLLKGLLIMSLNSVLLQFFES